MKAVKRLRICAHRILIGCGIDIRKKRRDRVVLETVIFPELLLKPEYRRILFVGCAWYTLHYPRLFARKEFSTLEIDPRNACFGAARHHIDSCEHVDRYYEPGTLDCIVCNGVFGFGLNDPDAIERTFLGMHRVLRPAGLLVFGWNDMPATRPMPIDGIHSLQHFEPVEFPPLGCSVYHSDSGNGHRFHFLRNLPPPPTLCEVPPP